MVHFSVIIPVYSDTRIKSALGSLIKEKEFKKIEVVIVKNCPTPEVEEILSGFKKFKNIKFFKINEKSVTKALNLGIKKSSARAIVLMGSDCTIEKGYINVMTAALKKHPLVRGKLITQKGDTFFSKLIADYWNKNINYNKAFAAFDPNLGIQKKVFEKIGYFDEDLFFNDYEFNLRVKENKIPVFFEEKAVMYHSPHFFCESVSHHFVYGLDRAKIFKKWKKKELLYYRILGISFIFPFISCLKNGVSDALLFAFFKVVISLGFFKGMLFG